MTNQIRIILSPIFKLGENEVDIVQAEPMITIHMLKNPKTIGPISRSFEM